MSTLSTLATIGGAAAGAFGGPIGIAAGAGLGALAHTMNERENVELQQKYYKENQKLALSQQHELNRTATPEAVQGMKDAGLSPASMNSPITPASRPAAPMGSKGESIQTAQTLASLANIEADTNLKNAQADKISGVDTDNVKADTALKFSERLFRDASADVQKQEAQRIENINNTFSEQNKYLSRFGSAMAQKWESSDWFKSLRPDTQETLRSIAGGELALSVGGMSALMDTIRAQEGLSTADKNLAENAFLTAVIETQASNDDIWNSIVEEPLVKYNLTVAQKDKIKAETDKLKYKYKEIIDEEIKNLVKSGKEIDSRTALNNIERKIRNLDFKKLNLDPDIRRYEGDILGYLGSMAQRSIDGVIDAAKYIGMGRAMRGASAAGAPAAAPAAARSTPMSKIANSPSGGFSNPFSHGTNNYKALEWMRKRFGDDFARARLGEYLRIPSKERSGFSHYMHTYFSK